MQGVVFTYLATLALDGKAAASQDFEALPVSDWWANGVPPPTAEAGTDKIATLFAWGSAQGVARDPRMRMGKVEGMGNAFLAESFINASASSPVPVVRIPLRLLLGRDGVETTCWGREIVRTVSAAIGQLQLRRATRRRHRPSGHGSFRRNARSARACIHVVALLMG